MKKNFITSRAIAAILALICLLSMALTLVSCSANGDKNESETGTPITITLTVTGPDGTSKEHTVKTDSSKNLRQALESAGLIAGEDYVETKFGVFT